MESEDWSEGFAEGHDAGYAEGWADGLAFIKAWLTRATAQMDELTR